MRLRHVLGPLDGSLLAECALPYARAVAEAFGSRITLLRVLEQDRASLQAAPVDPLDWEIRRAEAYGYLARFAGELNASGRKAEAELTQGRPEEQILGYARQQRVDLIVLASHGRGGLTAWNLGSTVQMVVQRASTAVLMVPAYRPRPEGGDLALRRILVPLDCSKRAEFVLPYAAQLARFHCAEMVLVHAVVPPDLPRRLRPSLEDIELARRLTDRNETEARRYLQWLAADLSSKGTPARTRILHATRLCPALAGLAEKEDADLVVLCAHGCSGESGAPYGATAATLLHEITRPLLLVQDVVASTRAFTAAEHAARNRPGH